MSGCNPTNVPLILNYKLMKEDEGRCYLLQKFYWQLDLSYCLEGQIYYLLLASLISWPMNSPSYIELGVGKRVVRYLQGSRNLGTI